MVDLKIKTTARIELIDITDKINDALAEIGAESGLCNLFVTHTTAAVIVSENWDPDVTTDMLAQLEHIVPRENSYRHGEGNSQAHILGVMLAEFDGPRERNLIVSVVALSAGKSKKAVPR